MIALDPQKEAEFQHQVQEAAMKAQAADEAGARAAYEPLPGPLKQVFGPQDIIIGKYRVRPFYGADFEWLSLLGHPLHKMMIEQQTGNMAANANYMPIGSHGWQIAWIMTRPVEDVDLFISTNGLEALAKASKAEFFKLRIRTLLEIHMAIMTQLEASCSTIVAYGSPKAEGEQSHPPSGAQLTVLGGS